MYDKEQIYDDQISPLTQQIIQICKDNGIDMISSFYLKEQTEVDPKLFCTTRLPFEQNETLNACGNILAGTHYACKHSTMSVVMKG